MFQRAVIDSGPLFSALVLNYDLRGIGFGRPPRFTGTLKDPLRNATAWEVDERLVRLLDLASDESLRTCLPDIGAIDAGLIQMALRHECVLITEDERTLARHALERGVDCRLVTQLVPLVA